MLQSESGPSALTAEIPIEKTKAWVKAPMMPPMVSGTRMRKKVCKARHPDRRLP